MEDARRIITLQDINQYFLKSALQTLVIGPTVTGLCCFSLSQTNPETPLFRNLLIADILLTGFSLFVANIIQIIRLKKGHTDFTVVTDVLTDKEDSIWKIGHKGFLVQLSFRNYRYLFYQRHARHFHSIYGMQLGEVYETALEGDSFTLITGKKEVLLAFNNKLFDVRL